MRLLQDGIAAIMNHPRLSEFLDERDPTKRLRKMNSPSTGEDTQN